MDESCPICRGLPKESYYDDHRRFTRLECIMGHRWIQGHGSPVIC